MDTDQIITANDLVIPAGRDISLRIKSNDVIHSWWAPKLNGKKDAVPGRTHPLTLVADKPGEYIGQCTEFCGLSHAEMRIKVVAMEPGAFDAWVKGQEEPWAAPAGDNAEAVEGWKSFVGACTSCHRVRGMTDPASVDADADPTTATKVFTYPSVVNQVSGAAPDLTHLMSRSTFAGAKFNLRKDTPACKARGEDWASTPDGITQCLNRNDLEAWLRNAPAMKAMYPGETMSPQSRGMPNFNLTDEELEVYTNLVEDEGIKYENVAVERFARTVNESRRLKVTTEWADKALEAINSYKPEEYPLFKEPKRALTFSPRFRVDARVEQRTPEAK